MTFPSVTTDDDDGIPHRCRAWPCAAGGHAWPWPLPARAQQRDSIPGVSLGLVYEGASAPALAIKPFTGRFGGSGAAAQVEAIVGRDLRNSDRFEVMDSLPPAITTGEGVDYKLWDRLGAVWLVTGQVEGAGDGYFLLLELHDVVYGQVRQRGRFPIPNPDKPGFRMAVHRASDAVVEWVTGEPGMAASRIAFSMRSTAGVKEVYVIDADGENLRKVTNHGDITMSPAWSPDGQRLAFVAYKDGFPRIFVQELATRRETELQAGQPTATTSRRRGRPTARPWPSRSGRRVAHGDLQLQRGEGLLPPAAHRRPLERHLAHLLPRRPLAGLQFQPAGRRRCPRSTSCPRRGATPS